MKKPTIKNILVPVDFSEISDRAIERAKELGLRFGANIHLVHVHEYNYPVGFMAPASLVPMSILTFQEEAAKRVTQEVKALEKKHGLPARACHLRNGTSIFNEICLLARELPADLIVTGTHGYTGMTHFLEGSTAERIVQHSPCPILVTGPGREKSSGDPANGAVRFSLNNVLVPVDFSGCSLAGLREAIDLAEIVGAKVIVHHAIALGYAYTSDGYAMYNLSAVTKAARKDAEGQMREFLRSAKFRNVKFETVITIGPPVWEICAMAKERDVDLIVTSTHGLTGFKHLLIGSVAERVVRHAPCAVLVVPSHPEMRAAGLKASKPTTRRVSSRRFRKSKLVESEALTARARKLSIHLSPERRKTNKFRESHSHV